MSNNRYLLAFCVSLIVLMGFVKTLPVDPNALKAQIIEIQGNDLAENMKGSATPSATPDVYDQLLLKDEEGGSDHVVIKKKVEEKPAVPKPYITAESYLVGNLETGEIYISHNPSAVFPIASVSKIYTALVVHHLFNLQDKITITQSMLDTYGDAGRLVLGEKFTAGDLLYPLLLESSNDVATAYAEYFGVEKFMQEMNGFAREIGMSNTRFKDPSGLSPLNLSNANDLFALTRYLHKNEKDILDVSKTKEISFPKTEDHESHTFVNINPYSNYTGFVGGKTGRTEWAKEAMVSLFNQQAGGTTYPIAVIILRSDMGEREIDTDKLVGKFIEYIKNK